MTWVYKEFNAPGTTKVCLQNLYSNYSVHSMAFSIFFLITFMYLESMGETAMGVLLYTNGSHSRSSVADGINHQETGTLNATHRSGNKAWCYILITYYKITCVRKIESE